MTERSKKTSEVCEDEIASRVVPDPDNPSVRRLTGFLLGRSNKDGYWRLYMNVDFDHYVEFEKKATLHAEQFREGRTVVWLKPDTKVRETKARSAPIEFLQGDISRGFARGVSGMVGPVFAADCPGSGCAHCTAACSSLPGTPGDNPNTVGYTCGC